MRSWDPSEPALRRGPGHRAALSDRTRHRTTARGPHSLRPYPAFGAVASEVGPELAVAHRMTVVDLVRTAGAAP